jgi:hypothetical protein
MSLPIKETPVLRGRDAKRFNDILAESSKKQISHTEKQRINLNFERLNKIANF